MKVGLFFGTAVLLFVIVYSYSCWLIYLVVSLAAKLAGY